MSPALLVRAPQKARQGLNYGPGRTAGPELCISYKYTYLLLQVEEYTHAAAQSELWRRGETIDEREMEDVSDGDGREKMVEWAPSSKIKTSRFSPIWLSDGTSRTFRGPS